ncbi:hypothetical protein [Peptoniphilus sp.]|jgi:hypothetical protein|uniref:hypothetical protein n=1 Tax=Peptoniphilus sp. TaxID=1971214 RepID=UPI003D8E6A42
MTGAISRGLNLSDFEKMTVGQVVDYCIEYNNIHTETKKENGVRKARQEDFNNF